MTQRLCARLTGLAGLIGATVVAAGGDPIPATFGGYVSREWGNLYNWDIYEVPNNKNGSEYAVYLTTDCSFFFDCGQPQITTSPGLIELTELHLAENVMLGVSAGVFRPGKTSFGYLSQIVASGADIEFTETEGDYGLLRVIANWDGAVSSVLTEIADCEYVMLQATSGSLADFSRLEHVGGQGADATFAASADAGMVDVRNLAGLDVASTWYAINGGVITAGPFSNSPIRFITVGEDSVITLPGVSNLNNAELRITGSGMLETRPIESFDNGSVILESGASYSMDIAHYFTDRPNGVQIRSRASTLAFPSLQLMEIADDVNLTIEVNAGLLNFPELTEIRGPGGRVWLTFGGSDQLRVPRLQRVEPTAFVQFSTGSHTVGPIDFLDVGSFSAGGAALVHINGSLNLSGADVSITGLSAVSADVITSIDDTDMSLQSGGHFAPAAAACSITAPGRDWDVYGSGSHLDAGALQNLHVDWPEGPSSFRIAVRDGGRITLGDVTITTAPDDRVIFEVDGPDSSIDIGPNSVFAGATYWKVVGGAEMRVPETVPIAPVSGLELRGGVLHLPGLTTFDEAWIGVYAATECVTSATDTDLHNTSVTAAQNWTFNATTWSWDRTGERTLFTTSRRLDAPSLLMMSLNPPPGDQPAMLRFRASGGYLDFSSVRTLAAPPSASMHVLLIETTSNNSTVDLSGLESATGDIKIKVDRYDSLIDWGTDLRHDAAFDDPAGSSFRNWTEGTLLCRGNVYITTPTRQSGPHLSSGRFIMAAPGTATMELENLDEGTAGVFAWGIQQFEIGFQGSPTRVVLVDDFDNGARGPNGEPEALYIGKTYIDQPLQFGPGASLVLNGFNVYVQSTSGSVLLNTLWPASQRAFAYGQGTLYRVDPAACPADFSAPFGVLNFFDAQEFLRLYSTHDQEADLDRNGLWNFFDLQGFLDSFASGCAAP